MPSHEPGRYQVGLTPIQKAIQQAYFDCPKGCAADVASTALHIDPGHTCTYPDRRQSKDQVLSYSSLFINSWYCNLSCYGHVKLCGYADNFKAACPEHCCMLYAAYTQVGHDTGQCTGGTHVQGKSLAISKLGVQPRQSGNSTTQSC